MSTEDLPADFQVLERESNWPLHHYRIDVPLPHLEQTLASYRESPGLSLDPDFQRAHVWSDKQRQAWIVYALQGAPNAMLLRFARPGGMYADNLSPLYLVDGRQRLESMLRFLRDELPVRGRLYRDWTGVLRFTTCTAEIAVANLDRVGMLRWYLAINQTGTPHTSDELTRVRALLDEALADPSSDQYPSH